MSNTRFAVLDWDGTLRPGWTVRAWLGVLADCGAKRDPQLQFDALVDRYRRGDYAHDELVQRAGRIYVDALGSFTADEIHQLAAVHAADGLEALHPFVPLLLDELRGMGLRIVVVSGAPALLLSAVRTKLPIDDVWALETQHDHGLWKIVSNPGLAAEKARIVDYLAQSGEIAIALGDSDSDEPLLRAAEVAVAVGSDELAGTPGVLRLDANGAGYDTVIQRLVQSSGSI